MTKLQSVLCTKQKVIHGVQRVIWDNPTVCNKTRLWPAGCRYTEVESNHKDLDNLGFMLEKLWNVNSDARTNTLSHRRNNPGYCRVNRSQKNNPGQLTSQSQLGIEQGTWVGPGSRGHVI